MAREIGFWKKVGTYITPVFTSGVDFLVRGANKYINFNSVTGESGYGIRDNNGTIEVKSSGGSWSTISTGGSSNIAYQATAPTDPKDGDRWIDTSVNLNAPVRSNTITNIVALTQAEYDALGTYDSTTLYYITA